MMDVVVGSALAAVVMVAFRGAGCVAGDGGGVGGDGRGCDGCVRRGRWWRSSVGRGGRLGGRCRIGARSGRRWPRRRPSIRSVSPLLGAEKRAYLVGVVRVPPVSVVLSLAYVRVSLETPPQHTAVLPMLTRRSASRAVSKRSGATPTLAFSPLKASQMRSAATLMRMQCTASRNLSGPACSVSSTSSLKRPRFFDDVFLTWPRLMLKSRC